MHAMSILSEDTCSSKSVQRICDKTSTGPPGGIVSQVRTEAESEGKPRVDLIQLVAVQFLCLK
jgi:hypothetical protein